jgi:hypothetical protein
MRIYFSWCMFYDILLNLALNPMKKPLFPLNFAYDKGSPNLFNMRKIFKDINCIISLSNEPLGPLCLLIRFSCKQLVLLKAAFTRTRFFHTRPIFVGFPSDF